MVVRRSAGVRWAAGSAAVALVFGLPVLIYLSSVASERWHGLLNTLLLIFIFGPIAAWFLLRRRPPPESPPD